MAAYYNEFDRNAAAWLRELIKRGLITPGDVDERSIVDVEPSDLRGYTRCGFFSGIGVWDYALRLAGWPDDRPVWHGSPPCQPFSTAGKRKADGDDRHLWPHWLRLIRECRPPTIFAEQVGSAVGIGWLDDVFVPLEQLGYACGAVVFPACSVGAPHRRERLYWVARQQGDGRHQGWAESSGVEGRHDAAERGAACELADAERTEQQRSESEAGRFVGLRDAGFLGDAERERLQEQRSEPEASRRQVGADTGQAAIGTGAPVNGFWADAEWIACRDGKARAVERGIFPLAYGTPKMLVLVCAECKAETAIDENMQTMWSGPSWDERLWDAEVLFREMQGIVGVENSERRDGRKVSGSIYFQSGNLQPLRKKGRTFGTSPHQQESSRQFAGEHRSTLLTLPSAPARQESPIIKMRDLWNRVHGIEPSEGEQVLFCPMCERMGPHLCEEKTGPSRIAVLKGAGNAIVAPQAAEFIRAFMDIIN